MKVWILLGNIDHEGSQFLGAFSTQENAEKHQAYVSENRKNIFDDFSIDEEEVDSCLNK